MKNNRIINWSKKGILFSLLFCNLSVAISQDQPSSVRIITCRCSQSCGGTTGNQNHVAAAIYPKDADFNKFAGTYCDEACTGQQGYNGLSSCKVLRNETYNKPNPAETIAKARSVQCSCSASEECSDSKTYSNTFMNTNPLFYAESGALCDLVCSDTRPNRYALVSCHVISDATVK